MSNMNDLLALVSQQRTAQGVPPPASTVAPVAREVTPAGTVTTFDASWAAAGKTAAPPQAVNPPVTQTAAALPPSVAGKDYDKTPPPPPVSVPPPADVRIRRTKDEIARGLTPEQAVAERMTARSTPPLLPAGPGSQHMAPADQLAAKTPEQIAAEGGFTSGGGGAGPATVSGATVAPRTSPTSEGLNIRTLYIGCLPVRAGGVVHFDLAVAHARVQLAKQGLADYRLAEYGKGKAYLLEHVISYLAKECAGQDVFVAHGGDEATVCLPHLRAAAREVVQNVAVAA